MGYLQTDLKEKLNIELPDRCRESRNWVSRLEKDICHPVHAILLSSEELGGDLEVKVFERS